MPGKSGRRLIFWGRVLYAHSTISSKLSGFVTPAMRPTLPPGLLFLSLRSTPPSIFVQHGCKLLLTQRGSGSASPALLRKETSRLSPGFPEGWQDRTYSSPLQPPVDQASAHLDDSMHCTDRWRATQAGGPVRVRPTGPMTLDNGSTWLYRSCMNNAIASALVQAAHRVESRLEEALAGVGLSIAKFETLSVLVSQDRSISLSELAAKLVCVKSNVTQLVDRLETEGLVKRANDPADRRAVRAEVTALGRKRQAAGTPVVNAVLQDVAKKLAAVDSQKLKRALDAIQ